MLKLKLQYFGHLMQRANSLEKTMMLGMIEGGRRRGWQQEGWMESMIQCTWVWATSARWWGSGKTGVLQSMGSQTVRHDWGTEKQKLSDLSLRSFTWLWIWFSCWNPRLITDAIMQHNFRNLSRGHEYFCILGDLHFHDQRADHG